MIPQVDELVCSVMACWGDFNLDSIAAIKLLRKTYSGGETLIPDILIKHQRTIVETHEWLNITRLAKPLD